MIGLANASSLLEKVWLRGDNENMERFEGDFVHVDRDDEYDEFDHDVAGKSHANEESCTPHNAPTHRKGAIKISKVSPQAREGH